MVELAIVMPFLLMLLFGITELGRALYQQNTLYKAVASGARYIARANGILDTASCATQGTWATRVNAAQNLIIYGQTSTGTSPLLPNLDTGGAVTIVAEARPLTKTDGSTVIVCVIKVNAEALFASLFGDIVIPFTNLATFNIRAETEERYIGY